MDHLDPDSGVGDRPGLGIAVAARTPFPMAPSMPSRDLPPGIQAALVVPFRDDHTVDEAAYRRQIEYVLRAEGITGLLINGHAGENALTDDAEKERIVHLTPAAAARPVFITSGVYAEGSTAAARQAHRLEGAGADALLVFPPNAWALGAEPESVVMHHRAVHDATGVPVLLYQAPVSAGRFAYPAPVLSALLALERIAGVKDGSWEIAATELVRDQVRAERPDVVVYGSGDEHLLVSYLIGTRGSQVSLASVIPDLICELWAASEAQDWSRAKALHGLIQPLANLVYRNPPASRAVARLKTCLVLLGVIGSDGVRPPLVRTDATERRQLEAALDRCGGLRRAA